MLSSKETCFHDVSVYNFSIRDTEGKLFLRISSGIKLKDFLKEMRKQAKKTSLARDIFYRNAVGRFILIDSQYELEKALDFTKYRGSMSLYVGASLNVKFAEIFGEGKCCGNKKIHSNWNQWTTISNKKNSTSNSLEYIDPLKEYINEKNTEYIEQICHDPMWRIKEPTKEKSCNNLHKKQKESKDTKVVNQLNDMNTECVPPPWFKEYMETMKKDMIYKITHEVTKKVTKKLSKHLDLFLPYIHEQNQLRNTSSLKRDSQCFSELIEKNQGQEKSQDEKQSSDTSIERMEEPQNANISKDVQVTKNERSTANSKNVKDISETLNKTSVNPITSAPSKKHEKSSNSIKENRREATHQMCCFREGADRASLEKKQNTILDRTQKPIEYEYTSEEKTSKKHQRDAQITTDNLENDAKSQEKSDENSFPANSKIRPIRSADWKPEKIENGTHMNCSVTGHQMLDENQQNIKLVVPCNKPWHKISFDSRNQEENDDDTFEIIQIPTSVNDLFTRHEETVVEQEQHNSNRDSPSFEILSEPSSPCSIYITEDHFAANERKCDEEDLQSNNSTKCRYLPKLVQNVSKSMNTDLEKQSDNAYSFVTEDFNSFCKSLHAKQRSNEVSQDDERSLSEDTCGLYDDVRNSHTSYLKVPLIALNRYDPQNPWSECLMQSFHSHTTSINDMTDVSQRSVHTDISHSAQMPSTDAQDATAIPSSLEPHVDNDRIKNAKMNERHDADNYVKCRASTPQNVSSDQHQYHRTNGFSDKSNPKAQSGKAFAAEQTLILGTVDPVHILPETLVIAAAQVGSFAYDTAREVFDKIRAHAKEDSTKRRSGKSDKKPFDNLFI